MWHMPPLGIQPSSVSCQFAGAFALSIFSRPSNHIDMREAATYLSTQQRHDDGNLLWTSPVRMNWEGTSADDGRELLGIGSIGVVQSAGRARGVSSPLPLVRRPAVYRHTDQAAKFLPNLSIHQTMALRLLLIDT